MDLLIYPLKCLGSASIFEPDYLGWINMRTWIGRAKEETWDPCGHCRPWRCRMKSWLWTPGTLWVFPGGQQPPLLACVPDNVLKPEPLGLARPLSFISRLCGNNQIILSLTVFLFRFVVSFRRVFPELIIISYPAVIPGVGLPSPGTVPMKKAAVTTWPTPMAKGL